MQKLDLTRRVEELKKFCEGKPLRIGVIWIITINLSVGKTFTNGRDMLNDVLIECLNDMYWYSSAAAAAAATTAATAAAAAAAATAAAA